MDDDCLVPKKTAVEVKFVELFLTGQRLNSHARISQDSDDCLTKEQSKTMSTTTKQWLSSQLGLISAYYYLECLIKESSSKMAIVGGHRCYGQ